MALKALDCPSCGGLIETFDETTKKGFCPYCDSLIVDVPDLQYAYEAKYASQCSADQMFERAEGFILIGRKDKALAALYELTDKHPADFRGWHMLCKLDAQSSLDEPLEQGLVEHARVMVALAKTNEQKESVKKVRSSFEKKGSELSEELETLSKRKAKLVKTVEALENDLQNARGKLDTAESVVSKFSEEHTDAKKAYEGELEEISFGLAQWMSSFATIGAAFGVIRVLANLGELSAFYGMLESIILVPVTLVVFALHYGIVGALAGLVLSVAVAITRDVIQRKKATKLKAKMETALKKFQKGEADRDKEREKFASVDRRLTDNKSELRDAEQKAQVVSSKILTIRQALALL